MAITTPLTGQYLQYNGTSWVNTYSGFVQAIANCTDVVLTSPSAGQILKYNGTDWVNAVLNLSQSLSGLSDVGLSSLVSGQYLKFNGTNWSNSTIPSPSIATCTDVNISGISNNEALLWNSSTSKWVNSPVPNNYSDFQIISPTTAVNGGGYNYSYQTVGGAAYILEGNYHINITLPQLSTLSVGETVTFFFGGNANNWAGGGYYFNTYPGDPGTIDLLGSTTWNEVGGTGIKMQYGETLVIAKNANSAWSIISGSMIDRYIASDKLAAGLTVSGAFNSQYESNFSNGIQVNTGDIIVSAGILQINSTNNPHGVFNSHEAGMIQLGQLEDYMASIYWNGSGTLTIGGFGLAGSSTPLTNLNVINFTGTNNLQLQINGTPFAGYGAPEVSINSLSGVSLVSPTAGQFLAYNGSVWENTPVSLTPSIATCTDVSLSSLSSGQVLSVNPAGDWTNTTLSAPSIATCTDVVLSSPSSGQVLEYNGTDWVNTTISGGGGFSDFTENGHNNLGLGPSAMIAANANYGTDNIGVGNYALQQLAGGYYNTALGSTALQNLTYGTGNTGIGYSAALNVTTQNYVTAIGYQALLNAGQGCTALGYNAGAYAIGGSSATNNTYIGYMSGSSSSAYDNTTCIGANSAVSASDQIQLGDSNTTTYVYGTVQNRSDIRDKTDIAPTTLGLSFINAIDPIQYRWDLREDYVITTLNETNVDGKLVITPTTTTTPQDGSKKRKRLHQGVSAQQVKQVMTALGVDFGGYQDHSICGGQDVLTIGYDEFIGPLIKAVQELSALNTALTARVAALEAKITPQ